MSRRAFVLSCLILLILFGFAWLARNTLQGRTAESTEGERAFAPAVLRSLESPALAPWLNKVTTLLRDHPRLVRYVVAQPGAKPAADVAEIAAGHILTFPHFANGAAGGVSIRASVILINNAGATATGKIFLWRNNGQSMSVGTNLGTGSTFNFTLRAGETLRLDTDGLGDLVVGWVEAQSDVEISGTAKFTTLDSAGRFLSEVGIGDSVRAKKLMILIDTTSGKDSGFAVCNPNAAGAASLSLNLRKMDGTSVGTVSSNLKPLNQTAQFVTQTFAGDAAENFKGLLVISSDTPLISVVTLRTQGLNYTSLPAVPEAPSGDAEDLLFARTGDGVFGNLRLQTSFFLMNNSAGPVSATLKSYAAAGGGLPLKIGGSREEQVCRDGPGGRRCRARVRWQHESRGCRMGARHQRKPACRRCCFHSDHYPDWGFSSRSRGAGITVDSDARHLRAGAGRQLDRSGPHQPGRRACHSPASLDRPGGNLTGDPSRKTAGVGSFESRGPVRTPVLP